MFVFMLIGESGTAHEAGFDAYMTGYSKCTGNIYTNMVLYCNAFIS